MASADKKAGGGLMPMLTVVLLLSLVGAGTGFAVGVFLQPGTEAAAVAHPAEAPAEAHAASADVTAGEHAGAPEKSADNGAPADEPAADEGLKVVPLPPIVTTLAAPEGKWIRLEGSILADPAGAGAPEVIAEKAGEQILAYLRTVKLAQIQGPSGFLALRDDLNETVSSLSKGEVRAVLIHGLLVE